MFVAEASSRPTSSGLRTTGRRRGSRGRDDLLGKIVALQRDLEEEPQGSGSEVGGRHRDADRCQPQLIAMDILGGSLVGRPAQEIGKLFDGANILILSPG